MAPSKTVAPANASAANVLSSVVNSYIDKTPQRTKLIDAFLGFLVLTGVLQFVYCVVAGNYVRLASSLSFDSELGFSPTHPM